MYKKIRSHHVCGLAGLAVLALAGCQPKVVRPMEIASDAGAKAVAKYDTNKDGVLSYQELAKCRAYGPPWRHQEAG